MANEADGGAKASKITRKNSFKDNGILKSWQVLSLMAIVIGVEQKLEQTAFSDAVVDE